MRGGKRAGSGRKPEPGGPKVAMTLWLTADVAKFLETFGRNRSKQTDATIRNTIKFIKWSRGENANISESIAQRKDESDVPTGGH